MSGITSRSIYYKRLKESIEIAREAERLPLIQRLRKHGFIVNNPSAIKRPRSTQHDSENGSDQHIISPRTPKVALKYKSPSKTGQKSISRKRRHDGADSKFAKKLKVESQSEKTDKTHQSKPNKRAISKSKVELQAKVKAKSQAKPNSKLSQNKTVSLDTAVVDAEEAEMVCPIDPPTSADSLPVIDTLDVEKELDEIENILSQSSQSLLTRSLSLSPAPNSFHLNAPLSTPHNSRPPSTQSSQNTQHSSQLSPAPTTRSPAPTTRSPAPTTNSMATISRTPCVSPIGSQSNSTIRRKTKSVFTCPVASNTKKSVKAVEDVSQKTLPAKLAADSSVFTQELSNKVTYTSSQPSSSQPSDKTGQPLKLSDSIFTQELSNRPVSPSQSVLPTQSTQSSNNNQPSNAQQSQPNRDNQPLKLSESVFTQELSNKQTLPQSSTPPTSQSNCNKTSQPLKLSDSVFTQELSNKTTSAVSTSTSAPTRRQSPRNKTSSKMIVDLKLNTSVFTQELSSKVSNKKPSSNNTGSPGGAGGSSRRKKAMGDFRLRVPEDYGSHSEDSDATDPDETVLDGKGNLTSNFDLSSSSESDSEDEREKSSTTVSGKVIKAKHEGVSALIEHEL